MFVDCYRVIFLNIVRFRLILQFRWLSFLEKQNQWMSRKIKSNEFFWVFSRKDYTKVNETEVLWSEYFVSETWNNYR